MTKLKKVIRVVKIAFGIVGLIFLIVGAGLTLHTYDFMRNARSVTGTVVSLETLYKGESTLYRPTLRFIDYEGREQLGETLRAAPTFYFDVGEKVEILYDTRDPSSLRLDEWDENWLYGLLFLAWSIVPFGIAWIIGWFAGRRTRPA